MGSEITLSSLMPIRCRQGDFLTISGANCNSFDWGVCETYRNVRVSGNKIKDAIMACQKLAICCHYPRALGSLNLSLSIGLSSKWHILSPFVRHFVSTHLTSLPESAAIMPARSPLT